MEIKFISIITHTRSPDIIYLHTDLPSSTPNLNPKSEETFTVHAQKGYGKEWCVKHFKDVPINIIDD
jgi:hypothetical protein